MAPFAEASVRAHGIAAAAARELSYVDLDARAGVELFPWEAVSRLSYRHAELRLNLEEGARFAVADRMEVEISLDRLDLNVGFGRRGFHDEDRSRDEIDAAVIRSATIGSAPAYVALGARSYRARRAAHHQLGATLSGVLVDVPVGKGLKAELMAVAAFDQFPSSGGSDGLLVFGTDRKRRDLAGRLSFSLWKRVGRSARVGASYDFARRWSTADSRLRFYPYTDHRGMVELRFFSTSDPWRRSAAAGLDHVAIPYRASTSREDVERMHEALRPADDLTQGCADVCDVP